VAIRRIDPEQITAHTQEYIFEDEDYGVKKADGAILIIRPLTTAEKESFDERMQKFVKMRTHASVKGRKGKGDSVEYSTQVDKPGMMEVIRERVKAALVGWKGFEDEDGNALEYTWENFLVFCETYRSLLDFADDCVDRVYGDVIARLDAHAKN